MVSPIRTVVNARGFLCTLLEVVTSLVSVPSGDRAQGVVRKLMGDAVGFVTLLRGLTQTGMPQMSAHIMSGPHLLILFPK